MHLRRFVLLGGGGGHNWETTIGRPQARATNSVFFIVLLLFLFILWFLVFLKKNVIACCGFVNRAHFILRECRNRQNQNYENKHNTQQQLYHLLRFHCSSEHFFLIYV